MTENYESSHIAEIKKTGDGSDTLISEQFNQPYHSLNGAVAESRYVYFQCSGLSDSLVAGEDLNILEIGFGTGMNLILLLEHVNQTNSKSTVDFYSVEAYPIDPETAASVSFGKEVTLSDYTSLLTQVFLDLKTGWNMFEVTDRVTLNLFIGRFNEIGFTDKIKAPPSKKKTRPHASSKRDGGLYLSKPINYILHDPFSPESNPEGWTPELFSTIAASSSDDAMLTTYSAASSARASMAVAGWNIARAPGALGKREMTVASLNPDKLTGRKRVNEKRLIERFNDGDFD
jgi:tRNA U34 5-methylaminomethyl-2-thiouridine-forming methyltransferase MnmC